MKRKIMNWLLQWKESFKRKPLILQGARQVGKTYSVLTFGKKYYDSVAYFNFENNKELIKIFDRDLDPERIVRELSINCGKSIFKEKTLIFFDEIQACERALTSPANGWNAAGATLTSCCGTADCPCIGG